LVVGNPCNTNALICMENAPRLQRKNFHALSRLDENRAKCQLALKAQRLYTSVHNLCVWGNHSTTQVCTPLPVNMPNLQTYVTISRFWATIAPRISDILLSQCASAVQSCLHDESSFASAAGSHAPALLWVWMRCILQMAHPMGVKHLISLMWLKMM